MSSTESPSALLGSAPNQAIETETAAREFRVLFCSWSELDIASGTPVIVCDMLRHFPAGNAEVLTEANVDQKRRRDAPVNHPVRKYRFHTWLWPFARGHRIRSRLARIGFPVLVGQLVRRIRRFKPDCMIAVYAQPHWILATWIASRLTGVPLVYHVHDAFLEVSDRRQHSMFASWLERKTLTSTRVLALDDTMAEHYQRRYGIHCTVVRHIVRHEPLPAKTSGSLGEVLSSDNHAPHPPRTLMLGFAGAIYESNLRQLAELCQLVNADPTLRLKIWTGSRFDCDDAAGPRIEVAFEADFERLLAQIATCDLLYLPLHFGKGASMAANAMAFSLPTKSFDYLLSGVPILVHCPAEFSLSRFFAKNRCAFVLNEPSPEAVRRWLDAWRAGSIPPLDERARIETLARHSVEENKRILFQVLGEEVARTRQNRRG